MEKGFFELAKKMLSEAGFKTDDNRMFTRDQQGYFLNPNIAATYSVELKEETDDVWVTTKKSGWDISPATRSFCALLVGLENSKRPSIPIENIIKK